MIELSINNIKVNNEDTIVYVFHQARTSDVLNLKVVRDDEQIKLSLKLETKK